METLLGKFDNLIDEQAVKMTDEEFQAAEKKFNQVTEKVRRFDPRGAVKIK